MEVKYYQKQYDCEDSHWWYLGRRSVIRRLLQAFTSKKNHAVLEIGCGSGGSLPLLAKFGESVTAVEMEPIAVEEARSRGVAEVVQGKLGDKLAVFDRQYDLIALFDVLEHIEDDAEALRQIRALLAPKGRLIITVPAYPFLWSQHDLVAHHHRRYTRARLLQLCRDQGYRVCYASYFNTLLFPFAMIALLASRFLSASPDVAMRQPWTPVNGVLTAIFKFEAFLVPRLRLPFGLSIAVVAEAA
ncbi:MAG: class I SAM-dependent methyltransferase [Stenotrophobium sp.]